MTGSTPGQVMEHCSFCGASSDSCKALVAGPQHVYICDACVDLCRKTIDAANKPDLALLDYELPNPDLAARWFADVVVHLLETSVRMARLPAGPKDADLPKHTTLQLQTVAKALRLVTLDVEQALMVATLSRQSGTPEPKTREPVKRRELQRRGPRLAPITDIFIAAPDFAKVVPIDPATLGLPSVVARGLTPALLAKLCELLEPGTRDVLMKMMPIPDPGGGGPPPWVLEVPGVLLDGLARLPASRSTGLARDLHPRIMDCATGWTIEDLSWAIDELRLLAERAKAEERPMWLWLDP